jgi:hypothetical protein
LFDCSEFLSKESHVMTTADVIREKAITLARAETPAEEAIRDLLECCAEKRVPVVLARQQFMRDVEESPTDPVVSRAVELLDRVLERLPMS